MTGTEDGSLTDSVAKSIRQWILERKLVAGTPIRQQKIAEELGVSRIPVREALRRLESEGMVIIRPHSGARVAVLDLQECIEIYKIRERVEPLALSESIPRLTTEQSQSILSLHNQVRSLLGDTTSYLAVDRAYHLATYAGVNSPRLTQMIGGFWNTTQHYRRVLLSTFSEEDFQMADAEHQLITDAVLTAKTRIAEEALRSHIERARMRFEDAARAREAGADGSAANDEAPLL